MCGLIVKDGEDHSSGYGKVGWQHQEAIRIKEKLKNAEIK